jgi:hypothetical protein
VRRRSVFFGAALLAAGLVGVYLEDSHHNACTSGLGPFGSMSGDLARNCGLDNTLFVVAFFATIVGLALMIAALLIRS